MNRSNYLFSDVPSQVRVGDEIIVLRQSRRTIDGDDTLIDIHPSEIIHKVEPLDGRPLDVRVVERHVLLAAHSELVCRGELCNSIALDAGHAELHTVLTTPGRAFTEERAEEWAKAVLAYEKRAKASYRAVKKFALDCRVFIAAIDEALGPACLGGGDCTHTEPVIGCKHARHPNGLLTLRDRVMLHLEGAEAAAHDTMMPIPDGGPGSEENVARHYVRTFLIDREYTPAKLAAVLGTSTDAEKTARKRIRAGRGRKAA